MQNLAENQELNLEIMNAAAYMPLRLCSSLAHIILIIEILGHNALLNSYSFFLKKSLVMIHYFTQEVSLQYSKYGDTVCMYLITFSIK